eukprot:scaffold8553_cov100-Isochrysis_galbana.AAC.6
MSAKIEKTDDGLGEGAKRAREERERGRCLMRVGVGRRAGRISMLGAEAGARAKKAFFARSIHEV